MTKTKFILSQPATNSAAETVRNGAKLGLKFSVAYVYTVRANAKRMSRDVKPGNTVQPLPLRLPPLGEMIAIERQLKRQKAARNSGKTADTQLRQLFGEVGLARSREIVAEMAGRFV